METPTSNILNHYRLRKVLGQGSEGTVYLVEDKETFNKLVLKIFHEPHTSDWFPGLEIYAEKICANDFGLPEVKLFINRREIIGLVHPYVKLSSLHWRILNSNEKVAQSIIGSYCRKQAYLMSEHGLAIFDSVLPHFRVDKNGMWHFVDIGAGIRYVNDSWAQKHGLIGYGFASLIMGIYNKEIHLLMAPVENYSLDDTCVYCKNEWLDAIARQHKWVHEILSEVHSNEASIFYDPEFYQRLSEYLPNRVPWPSMVLPVSKTLFGLGKLRGKLGL